MDRLSRVLYDPYDSKSRGSNNFSNYLNNFLDENSKFGLESILSLETDSFLQLFGLEHTHKEERFLSNQNYNSYNEIIFTGCSETTGHLLAEQDRDFSQKEYVWGSIVSRELGLGAINTSVGGASAFSIINELLQQISSFGAPKHLFILFPHIATRISAPRDPSNYAVKYSNYDGNYISHITGIGMGGEKYSKKPHPIEEVLPKSFVTYLNITSILLLEYICKINNTNLIYSTWSGETDAILKSANIAASDLGIAPPFKNYIELEHKEFGRNTAHLCESIPETCHLELSHHKRFKYGRANHMGVHAHIHIAETFIKELTNRGFIASF